jgi:hypothetical protein
LIAQRALAVIAAVLLVAAVGIATFGPQSVSLGQVLVLLDETSLDALMKWSNSLCGPWAWGAIVQPLLVRPAWLLPGSAGLICSGLAMSLSNRKTTHRSHRRS